MNVLTYATGDADVLPCKSDVMLSKTSSANYLDCRPVLATHRRLLCMNVKQQNVFRVINRHGKYTDTTIAATKVAHLVSTEKMTSHPTLFYAVGGRNLTIISPNTQANGDLSVSVTERIMDEELCASTPGEVQRLYILGAQNVLEVEESTGVVKGKIARTPKSTIATPIIDYHQSAQLLLLPSKSNHLDLVSTRTRKSVLTRAWEPHEDVEPTFACFFQHHSFSEEGPKELLLVTAARKNCEIRFWGYQNDTQTFTLKQQLNIASKEDESEAYDISVTANEEYVTLCSRTKPYAVVIETHRTLFKAFRVTSWRTAGPALCSTTSVGKVAESIQSKSVSYELFITVRTTEGFVQSMPDSNRLAGASNLTVAKVDSVASWFPEANAEVGAGASAMAPITAVSSSLTGESKTSGVPETAVANIVRMQANKFCAQVKLIDTDLVAMQKSASNTMRLLQDPAYREEARSSGRSFAVRNRSRLEKQDASSPPSVTPTTAAVVSAEDAEFGVMTENERELVLSIKRFVQEVQGGSAAAASAALQAFLHKQLKISVEKAANEMGKLDVQGSFSSNIGSTESAAEFRRSMNGCVEKILSTTKRYQELNRTTSEASTLSTASCLRRADAFRQDLLSSLESAKTEVAEVKTAIAEYQQANVSGGTAAVPDPDVVLSNALTAAKEGNWVAAMTGVLDCNDIGVLLNFLENPICQENLTTLTSPSTLTLPLFLSLCLQLTFEVELSPGTVPLRLLLLADFYVEWDDTLRGIRTQAAKNPSQANIYEVVHRELTTVLAVLETVRKDQLDRRSRNKERLVHKLITQLLMDE